MFQVVTSVIEVVKKGASVCRLAAQKLLHSLATVTFNTDQNQKTVFHQISSLFAMLLQDSDPLVKQTALEVFAYFAYITKHPQIITDIVGDDDELQTLITKYLQRSPISSTSVGLETYLKSVEHKYVHKCSTFESNPKAKEEFDPNFMNKVLDEYIAGVSDVNPTKRLKTYALTESSAVSTLQRVYEDCNVLIDYFKQNTAPAAVKEKLQSVLGKIESLHEFL